jgi:RNA recognition motif-containing protein
MRLFVGNLSFSATGDDVKKVFEAFGVVEMVSIRKKTGQNSRGFGVVAMPNDEEALAAIAALEGKEFMGRPMTVAEERPKPVKPKKDFKEIKRQKLEAKAAAEALGADKPARMFPKDKEVEAEEKKAPVKEFKAPVKRKSRPGSKPWEKRKGTGTEKAWKKKPGGIKKKFRTSK